MKMVRHHDKFVKQIGFALAVIENSSQKNVGDFRNLKNVAPLPAFCGDKVGGAWGGSIGLLAILYYIVMEATQGATLGKMALGLRVVKTNGSPISWSESIIRNLLRIIDGLFFYLVGAILIWNSPLRQRLGDRAANTVVVRRRR